MYGLKQYDLLFSIILWIVWTMLFLPVLTPGCIQLAGWLALDSARLLVEACLSHSLSDSISATIEFQGLLKFSLAGMYSFLWLHFLECEDQPILYRAEQK